MKRVRFHRTKRRNGVSTTFNKCRNCGLPLRSEESRRRGFGPTCALYFAHLWVSDHPMQLGERAKKRWTADEITRLMRLVKT